MPEPNYSRLILESKGKVLVDEKDLWPSGLFVTTHLIVIQEFLKKYPATVKKLLQGHLESLDHIEKNDAEAQTAANVQLEALSGEPLKDEVLKSSAATAAGRVPARAPPTGRGTARHRAAHRLRRQAAVEITDRLRAEVARHAQ